jgi:AraC-like DNA-binding protein
VLAKLVFNDETCFASTDIRAVGDVVAGIVPKIEAFSSLAGISDFHLKMASVEMHDLRLLSYAQTGIYFERKDFIGGNLIIPTRGQSQTEIGEETFHFKGGETAFFSGEEPRQRHCFLNDSGVDIRLDIERLNSTCASMMGLEPRQRMNLSTRTPILQSGGIPFFDLFEGIFHQINAVNGKRNVLDKLALDDSIYRLSVGLLHPTLFQDEMNGRRVNFVVRSELLKLCEYMRENLTKSVSLTDMESRSGLSARVLQYSFQRTFGLRPKEWLRRERLHAARAVLMKCFRSITTTAVAYRFCFSSPSEFARYYRGEFGELPAETLARKRR